MYNNKLRNKIYINHQLTKSKENINLYTSSPVTFYLLSIVSVHYEVFIKQIIYSSPSYYYQHQFQNQLDNQQIDNDSDYNPSQSEFSNQQEYKIYHNTIISPSNKNNTIEKQPKNKNPHQKLKPSQQNHIHFDQQQFQQKNHFLSNQDRSLKVNQIHKKTQNLINKNKSLSSPSDHPYQKKIFKKQKPNKQSQTKQKHQNSKANLKPKKVKIQKQKKVSNGSLSTDNTKIVSTKQKKPKTQIKKICEKSHNVTKSSHNLSQQSNEFLVLGQNLYDYQDMSRVATAKQFYDRKAFVNELQKQKSKKVKFNEWDQQHQESMKRNENSLSIYDPLRLQKKVNKTIAKIEKYFLGFFQAQAFQSAKMEALQDTENLSIQKKIQLYHKLMKDSQLSKEIQETKKVNKEDDIDDVIRLAIEKVQKKSQKLSQMYEQEKSLISKWKNSKLHQLSTAKRILQRLMGQDSSRNHIKRIPHSNNNQDHSNRDPLSTPNDLQQIQDIQQDPLYLLQKELQQIMSQEYYPQLKKHTLILRKSITELLKNQQFPEPKPTTQTEVVEQSRMQNTQNYFTPNGVLWFFDKFFTFIIQKPNYIPELVEKLNEGFGFDVQTKKVIAKTKDYEKWYDFFGQGQNSVNHKSLIDASTFQEFQQHVIKPDPELSLQTQGYMHHFNQAIIDSFNQQFHRFRPFYPYGEPLPHLQKPGKYFQINNQSIFYFFEKSKYHIYTDYITFFAGLILPQGQQETKQTKQYNVSKQIKLVNQQMLYDWEFYHCLFPVAKLATLEELYRDIEKQIYNQVAKDLLKISKTK